MTNYQRKKNSYALPLTKDTFDHSEIEAAKNVLESGFYSMGEQVELFEKEFCDFVGSQNAVMVNSGSSANLLMVFALVKKFRDAGELEVGDEVLIPALLWPTTLWPILQAGLVPVLVDIDTETLNICLLDAEKKITPRSKAMFYIHVLGNPKNIIDAKAFCEAHQLVLLEDCCESLGARCHSKHVGNFGMSGSFSHFFSHHITTMEGGTIVTNDVALADDLRSMRAHGWIRDRSDKTSLLDSTFDDNIDPRWFFLMPGFNVRPMEIQAAIGRIQLTKLDTFLRQRTDFVSLVSRILEQINWLSIIGVNNSKDFSHSWMNIPIRVHIDAPVTKNYAKNIFEKFGVETRPIISGNFINHAATKYIPECGPFPNTDIIDNSSFMMSALPPNYEQAAEYLEKLAGELKKI